MKRYIMAALGMLALVGCQTTTQFEGIQSSRIVEMNNAIRTEPPGDYFIGRRYFKRDYKFWGYVREPGKPWNTARLVMMNEQQKLAPDRAGGTLGSDHGYEYKLYGRFSGATIYEPSSNGFYPEFVLTGYELRSAAPPPILRTAAANDPERRVMETPR